MCFRVAILVWSVFGIVGPYHAVLSKMSTCWFHCLICLFPKTPRFPSYQFEREGNDVLSVANIAITAMFTKPDREASCEMTWNDGVLSLVTTQWFCWLAFPQYNIMGLGQKAFICCSLGQFNHSFLPFPWHTLVLQKKKQPRRRRRKTTSFSSNNKDKHKRQ